MKRLIAAAILTVGLTSFPQVEKENGRHIVLPSPQLLGCTSSGCSQLWQHNPADPNAIYPRQVTIDLLSNKSNPCPFGVTALYERSVSTDDLKASIDEHYGKWAYPDNATSPVKLWRVEPEKFAIQLAVTSKERVTREQARAEALSRVFGYSERSNVAEGGMSQVVYVAFAGTKCGGQ